MNIGLTLSESPARRVSEIHTQAGGRIINKSVVGTNPSMSTGSGFEIGESSRGQDDPFDAFSLKELEDQAAKMGVKYKRKAKDRLREQLKITRDERNRSSSM